MGGRVGGTQWGPLTTTHVGTATARSSRVSRSRVLHTHTSESFRVLSSFSFLEYLDLVSREVVRDCSLRARADSTSDNWTATAWPHDTNTTTHAPIRNPQTNTSRGQRKPEIRIVHSFMTLPATPPPPQTLLLFSLLMPCAMYRGQHADSPTPHPQQVMPHTHAQHSIPEAKAHEHARAGPAKPLWRPGWPPLSLHFAGPPPPHGLWQQWLLHAAQGRSPAGPSGHWLGLPLHRTSVGWGAPNTRLLLLHTWTRDCACDEGGG